MSEGAAIEPGASRPALEDAGWTVRPAAAGDVAAVAAAVEELLLELGGSRPRRAALEGEALALVDDPAVGALLLAADSGGEVVGVLGASWQRAIHVPGPYLTIQDLWVERSWRSRGVGAGLVEAAAELARERGVGRIEVGLPRETFAAIRQTESFYEANGFELLGVRMRRLLDEGGEE